MTSPNYTDAKRLNEQVKQDSERFRAFLYGYVQGAQDMDADMTFTEDEFAERVRELYRDEYPEAWL